jgi:hypothetical protein
VQVGERVFVKAVMVELEVCGGVLLFSWNMVLLMKQKTQCAAMCDLMKLFHQYNIRMV